MTPLQRYIAEEIATDHVDGLLTRREAMRRLGLLGVSAAAASALIAACSDEKAYQAGTSSQSQAPAPSTPDMPAEPPPGMDQALETSPITWSGPSGELQGAWAQANQPRGGVLVIHENKGLNDWTRSVAGRLAGAGYSALAVDLLSAQGGTATFADPAEATAALGNIAPEALIADIKSGIGELQQRVPGQKVAAVGFCMGGGLVWQLLASGAPELAAAVPFYGPAPENPDFAGSAQVAVLAFYGELDARVNATEPAASAALDAAGVPHDVVIEPGADHAFFNDTGQRYNAVAAQDAWTRMQDWFGQYLAPS
jgi:carboxymethylenebutenolidase